MLITRGKNSLLIVDHERGMYSHAKPRHLRDRDYYNIYFILLSTDKEVDIDIFYLVATSRLFINITKNVKRILSTTIQQHRNGNFILLYLLLAQRTILTEPTGSDLHEFYLARGKINIILTRG